MVGPDEKAENGDRQTREGDKAVPEDGLTGKRRHDLTRDPHGWQDHDVDRRMGIEPEQVLKEDRIAATCRIEDRKAKYTLDEHEQDRDGDDWRTQHLNQAGRIHCPDEE